jgi:ElaB/YqjD/DUF883 family membrane-anchored ribosome-binding protein
VFQPRSQDFDPHISAIAGHLRAVERELRLVGKKAGSRATASASATGNQISATVGTLLSEIVDSLSRGQRAAVDETTRVGNEAIKFGAAAGNNALTQIVTEARRRPFTSLAVAIGVGVLIGTMGRRK